MTKATTQVIIPAAAKVSAKQAPAGWGNEYQEVTMTGQAIEFQIKVGNRAGVSIRVNEAGDLTVTNYGGFYDMQVPQNMRLTNSHPWGKS